MKVRLTEQQINYIKHSLNENYVNSSPESIRIANQLFSDPNNLTLWHLDDKDLTDSIFKSGYSADWYCTGEGAYHGRGLYAFWKPYGAQVRWGTGGVGNCIKKGVLKNGFKDFLILEGDLAMKYYNSYDIRMQADHLYGSVPEFKRIFLQKYYSVVGSYEVPHKRTTGFISKALWDAFHEKLKTGGIIRGVVYNGGQDPNACLIYNPREFIPICYTNERYLNNSKNDFDNWVVRVTPDLLNKIETFDDYYAYGERLKAEGLIRDYAKVPPKFGFLRVVLNNGKTSYYDIKAKKLISKVGFDISIGFEKSSDGTIACECVVKLNNREAEFFIVPYEGTYYICHMNKETGDFEPLPKLDTTEKYDKVFGRTGAINEDYNHHSHQGSSNPEDVEKIKDFKSITNLNCYLTSVYHRTNSKESCDSICKYGFSPQFSNTECYGHGMYSTLTSRESSDYLSGYGRYMIHAYSKDGFKNYVIFDKNLARKYYGDKYEVYDQLKILIRPEYYKEIMSRHPYLAKDQNIIATLEANNELGMTSIRGSIVWYGSCYIAVVCDWKSVIPYEYSTDDGRTWIKTLTDGSFNYINNFQDGLFALNPFISDGIIKDTFGPKNYYGRKRDWSSDPNAHPQFINGYIRVVLTNGKISFYSCEDKNLISYAGFDKAISWEKDEDGTPCLYCEIADGKFAGNYKIVKDGGKYYFTRRAKEKDENGNITIVDRVVELRKTDGSTVYFTTGLYDRVCGYAVKPK